MDYIAGNTYYGEFTTCRFDTGVATSADSTPVATANKNGADDGTFTLTVTSLDAGRYKITGTVPAGYAAGDKVKISVAATVNSVAAKAVVDKFEIGPVNANVVQINSSSADAYNLGLSLDLIKVCTVDTANFSATSTDFETSSISDATTNVYKDKSVYFTSGNLIRQAKLILTCSLISGKVHITTSAFTGAPSNADTFFIA
jgi:hypothetical protein